MYLELKSAIRVFLLFFLAGYITCFGQRQTNRTGAAFPVIKRSLKPVSVAPDFDTTLVSQYFRSIYQDSKGNLWFGTIGEGVVRYDVKTLTYFTDPEGFVCTSVFSITEDRSGMMWFGTDQGVYRYDGRTFRKYGKEEGLNHLDISRKSMVVDRQGRLWVGTHGGVYTYDPAADGMGKLSFFLAKEFPAMNVAGLHEDSRGHLWVASSDKGVFRYDGRNVTSFNDKPALGENYAGGIAEDKNGNLWFTMKGGICTFDGTSFTEYTTQDGLGGTEFWGIIIEKSGIIWVTARGSTTRFDPSIPQPNRKAFTVYTAAEGMTCCVQSMYQDNQGRMWWGTGQGLYRFDGRRFYQVRKTGPW